MPIPQLPMIERLRICAFFKVLFPCLSLFISPHATAATPCDFKGVFVGDKTTPAELMNAFGVKNYKMNPERPKYDKKKMELVAKYGSMEVAEIEDWDAGAACDDHSCRIPFGVSVGNSNTPVSVYISFPEGRITEIDVIFNEVYWNEVMPIIDKKYGADWDVEREPDFVITDLETKRHSTVERILITHQRNGTNPKTGDTCQIWARNYDIIFTHHDPVGKFHSEFVIKLVSSNF